MKFLIKFAAKKYLRYKKVGLERNIYARHLKEVSLNSLPY